MSLIELLKKQKHVPISKALKSQVNKLVKQQRDDEKNKELRKYRIGAVTSLAKKLKLKPTARRNFTSRLDSLINELPDEDVDQILAIDEKEKITAADRKNLIELVTQVAPLKPLNNAEVVEVEADIADNDDWNAEIDKKDDARRKRKVRKAQAKADNRTPSVSSHDTDSINFSDDADSQDSAPPKPGPRYRPIPTSDSKSSKFSRTPRSFADLLAEVDAEAKAKTFVDLVEEVNQPRNRRDDIKAARAYAKEHGLDFADVYNQDRREAKAINQNLDFSKYQPRERAPPRSRSGLSKFTPRRNRGTAEEDRASQRAEADLKRPEERKHTREMNIDELDDYMTRDLLRTFTNRKLEQLASETAASLSDAPEQSEIATFSGNVAPAFDQLLSSAALQRAKAKLRKAAPIAKAKSKTFLDDIKDQTKKLKKTPAKAPKSQESELDRDLAATLKKLGLKKAAGKPKPKAKKK